MKKLLLTLTILSIACQASTIDRTELSRKVHEKIARNSLLKARIEKNQKNDSLQKVNDLKEVENLTPYNALLALGFVANIAIAVITAEQ